MNITRAAKTVVCIFLLAFFFSACEQEGPAEKTGEKIDEAVEDTKEMVEETGEELQESLKETGEKMQN